MKLIIAISTVCIILISTFAYGAGQGLRMPMDAPGETRMRIPTVRVSMTMERGGIPIVSGYINGKGPYRLGIDWGTNAFLISGKLAEQLRLTSPAELRFGRGDPVKIFTVESISIGDAEFRGMTAVGDNFLDRSLDAVLGFNVFTELLMRFDFSGRYLVLERRDLPAVDGRKILPLSAAEAQPGSGISRERYPHITIGMGDISISAALDLKSPEWAYLPDSMISNLTITSGPVALPQQDTRREKPLPQVARVGESLKVGIFKVEQPVVVFSKHGIPRLGMGFLGNFIVTLDRANGAIRFERNSTDPMTIPQQAWEITDEDDNQK